MATVSQMIGLRSLKRADPPSVGDEERCLDQDQGDDGDETELGDPADHASEEDQSVDSADHQAVRRALRHS